MIALGFASGYAGGSNRPAIELAERLAALAYPSINHFFFTSGGAEANETAIKVARSFWKMRGKPGKTKVISRELGYHGVTLAAMSATGLSAYWPRFEPREFTDPGSKAFALDALAAQWIRARVTGGVLEAPSLRLAFSYQ